MAGRDDIDFGTTNISRLFTKMFIPTLLGMVSWSLLTVIDGVFVGHGVGSNGIAAINICYPIFLVLTGFALMVGTGASVPLMQASRKERIFLFQRSSVLGNKGTSVWVGTPATS